MNEEIVFLPHFMKMKKEKGHEQTLNAVEVVTVMKDFELEILKILENEQLTVIVGMKIEAQTPTVIDHHHQGKVELLPRYEIRRQKAIFKL